MIERALNAGYEPVSMLVEEKHIATQAEGVINLCGDIPIFTAEFDLLTKLTGYKLTRGALCVMRRKKLPDISEVCKNTQRIAVLENVVNPTNVGAIFRSAAALGMDAVMLTKGCSDPLYRRAARVSMGTVFQIPWTFCSDTPVDDLKKMGFKTAAMALWEDSVDINNPDLVNEKKLAVVLGTEGEGLSVKTIEDCDYTVCIPMAHGVDSLNVAAASAVAFWQLGRNNM